MQGRQQFAVAALICASGALGGCVSTAASIITAPVRAAGKVVDWSTTSQEESDRNRGRALRQRDAEIGRLQRQRDRLTDDCQDGERRACERQEQLDEQIAQLRDRPV